MRDKPERNKWREQTGHRGCTFPCSGHPVARTRPGKVRVEADNLPVYLTCSECGYTPLSKYQPKLIERFVRYHHNQQRSFVKQMSALAEEFIADRRGMT